MRSLRHWGVGTLLALILVPVLWTPASAQIVIGGSNKPAVEVDPTVLDRLGKEPTLPGLFLGGRPAGQQATGSAPLAPKAAQRSGTVSLHPITLKRPVHRTVKIKPPKHAKRVATPVVASAPATTHRATTAQVLPAPVPTAQRPAVPQQPSVPPALSESKPSQTAESKPSSTAEPKPTPTAEPKPTEMAPPVAHSEPVHEENAKSSGSAELPTVSLPVIAPTSPAKTDGAEEKKTAPTIVATKPDAAPAKATAAAPATPADDKTTANEEKAPAQPTTVTTPPSVAATPAAPPEPLVPVAAKPTPAAPVASVTAPNATGTSTGTTASPQEAHLPPAAQPTPATGNGETALSIPFEKDGARLPNDVRASLSQLAERLAADPVLQVQMLAYAEGDEDNASKARRLSLSRALAVRSYLIDQGVRSTRIEVRALGNKVPDGPADRVDILVQKR
ncbi:OmpA family protein [Telmatospirillum sp.]|uniref:OmpA family protein n=1 Tax=Telmatospirillum sp. TaxID=2079197 RepID=UPI002848BDAD|nr:OmpA family protein [Telmatospirillum sp.]MDR3437997.1 OmpA family protein [Telmatospirillum sp.]